MSDIDSTPVRHQAPARATSPWHERATVFLLAGLLLGICFAASAQDYEAGKRAYLAGDYAEALRIWRPLAGEGNKFAQFSLGSLYFEGAGVDPDYAESAKWFRRSAEQGYAPAQFNLGNAYKHGNGVEQDDLQAAQWWRKAAEQEFAPAQFNLGTQYYFGRGVAKDEETAIRWYRRAAENGHPQAQRLFSMSDSKPSEPSAGAQASATEPQPEPAAAEPPSSDPAAAGTATVAAAEEPEPDPASPAGSGEPAGAVSGGDALAGESWLRAQDPSHYTLQLLATHSENVMVEYLRRHEFQDKVAYFGFERDGKRWYAAVHGAYPGKAQAQAAVATLPATLKEKSPWIRRFAGIQALIGGN